MALCFALTLSLQTTFAQETEEVTDEELTKYALVMTKLDSLGEQVKATFNEMVKSHELMDGGRNYMTLDAAKGDSVKIAESGLGPDVLAAYDELKDAYDSLQNSYKEEYTRMVKEDLGVSTYNEVRKGLKDDPEVKERYSAIVKEIGNNGDGE